MGIVTLPLPDCHKTWRYHTHRVSLVLGNCCFYPVGVTFPFPPTSLLTLKHVPYYYLSPSSSLGRTVSRSSLLRCVLSDYSVRWAVPSIIACLNCCLTVASRRQMLVMCPQGAPRGTSYLRSHLVVCPAKCTQQGCMVGTR